MYFPENKSFTISTTIKITDGKLLQSSLVNEPTINDGGFVKISD